MIKKRIEENWPHILIALAYHFIFCLIAAAFMHRSDAVPIVGALIGGGLYLVYWIAVKFRSYMPWCVYVAFLIGTAGQFILNITHIIRPDEGFFLSGLGQAVYELELVAYVIILGIVNLVMYGIYRIRVFRQAEAGTLDGYTGRSLPTPVGNFKVFVNNRPVVFTATVNREPGLYGGGGTDEPDRPDGLFHVVLDMSELNKDDVILGRIVGARMKGDGGDEHTMNMVGINDRYTFGLGTVDDADWFDEADSGKKAVPFHLNGLLDDGFELVMEENPEEYPMDKEYCRIFFDIAWKAGTDDRAWNVISYVTC